MAATASKVRDIMEIDRNSVVGRHDIHLTAPSRGLVVSVGDGDFAFTADITGLQTFTDFHHVSPTGDPRGGDRVTNTCTMSTWGWHEEPNPEGYVLDDATSQYESRRGPVPYADRPYLKEMMKLRMGGGFGDRADLAGMWLIGNPHRLDLGRIGLELTPTAEAEPEADPSVLSAVEAHLDLWRGVLTSRFTYLGQPVEVVTVAQPGASGIAFRVTSPLLATRRVAVRVAFPEPDGSFMIMHDWSKTDGHSTELAESDGGHAVVHRSMDSTRYDLQLSSTDGVWAADGHTIRLGDVAADSVEVVATFVPVAGPGSDLAPERGAYGSFAEAFAAAERFWESFWTSGAAIDTAGSTDPRAAELERRVVLSQYLTRVHGGGLTPPQETGFVTNSWNGKFHLEMHWWHSAHFPLWGRPELLERQLRWYESIHERARGTAQRQGYAGARWPKQIGPDGRESPSDIGALLIWQQPHLMSYAELLYAAYAGDADRQAALVERLATDRGHRGFHGGLRRRRGRRVPPRPAGHPSAGVLHRGRDDRPDLRAGVLVVRAGGRPGLARASGPVP